MSDEVSIDDLPAPLNDKNLYVVQGKHLNATWALIRRLWRGDNVDASNGIGISKADAMGYSLVGTNGVNGGVDFPWKISVRGNPGGSGLQAMVSLNSDILLSRCANDFLTVTGLETWFSLLNNDVIWVHCTVASATVTDATIHSYGLSNDDYDPTITAAWANKSWVQNDGASPPNQTVLNILIGYTTPTVTGAPYLIQAATQPFRIRTECQDGLSAQVAVVSEYRRYGIVAPTP